jgi:hypothetical protein
MECWIQRILSNYLFHPLVISNTPVLHYSNIPTDINDAISIGAIKPAWLRRAT